MQGPQAGCWLITVETSHLVPSGGPSDRVGETEAPSALKPSAVGRGGGRQSYALIRNGRGISPTSLRHMTYLSRVAELAQGGKRPVSPPPTLPRDLTPHDQVTSYGPWNRELMNSTELRE